MAEKRKARAPTGKTRKPKETQKEQSARFIEAARVVGVDETGDEFERAMNRISPTPKAALARRVVKRASS